MESLKNSGGGGVECNRIQIGPKVSALLPYINPFHVSFFFKETFFW